MNVSMKSNQQVDLVASGLNVLTGNPAPLQSPPSWSVSNPAILSVAHDPVDPNKATIKGTGVAGSADVTVNSGALPSVVVTFSITAPVVYATQLVVTAGTPVVQS
jgi:hypothetical protein